LESSTNTAPPRTCLSKLEQFIVFETIDEDSGIFLVLDGKQGGIKESLEKAYYTLARENCYLRAVRSEAGVVLQVASGQGGRSPMLALGLAIATLATLYVSGYSFPRRTGFAWSPLGYLLGIFIPLLIHELGHFSVMRKYKVPSSLPYFIPAPPLQMGFIGTFGAVINMRWLPARNRHLALMALAGPLAGFLAAIPVAYYGIHESIIMPARGVSAIPVAPLIFLLFPPPATPGPGEAVVLSPMAFAAYVVFFVTFLNLIPIGMLDGGHIVRALLGERGHAIVSNAFIILLFAAGAYYPGLLLFAFIAMALYLLSKGRDPGSAILEEERDNLTVLAGILYGVLLVLTMPVPV
jgi:membrane-associated protease RseP (regulator of RpoE activity)